MRSSLYCSYDLKEKECGGDCGKVLPFEAFSKVKSRERWIPRSKCRACNSAHTAKRQRERRMELFPSRYRRCENIECKTPFSKKFIRCPGCGLDAG
jgi:hypothetical protein